MGTPNYKNILNQINTLSYDFFKFIKVILMKKTPAISVHLYDTDISSARYI